jgi:ABC-2 type transport system permease protein
MAATIIIPIFLATRTSETKRIAVLDETGVFTGKFKDSDNFTFYNVKTDRTTAKESFSKSGDHAFLYIPKTEVALPTNAIIYSDKNVGINISSYIKNVMVRQVEELKLQARIRELQTDKDNPVSADDVLRSIKTTVDINSIKIAEDGQESKSYTQINMALGYFAGILIYFFIFMFGAQVMRGVIEEKTSRIVEVIISSVKPFQLMMGKIIGVGLVGLTQFLLWVVLTFAIVTVVTATMTPGNSSATATEQLVKQQGLSPDITEASKIATPDNNEFGEVMEAINSVDFPVMIGTFIFFFIFGYLLYAALFAAIGGAVDSEADTQQFMLPITIPLILSIIMAQFVIQEPDGPVAFWLSIFPLTSPVIMMIRIPFGVPYYEVMLSMFLLVLGFIGTTWMAGKIYRTGILMYGKKVNYKELWKWLRY